MTQNVSFDIKIPEGHRIEFNQEATFENFVAQFQPYCRKLLCVIDGTTLRYYDKTAPMPSTIKFEYKQRRGTLTEYYFRDIYTQTQYCVFGRDSAKIFYPSIDNVDSESTTRSNIDSESTDKNKRTSIKSTIPMFRESINKSPRVNEGAKNIIIVDGGVKHIFSNTNYPIEIKTYRSY